MQNVVFRGESLAELVHWARSNPKIVEKIYKLISDIDRNGPAKGIGKPERLKYKDGWSRHITDEHRLIYSVDEGNIYIISCKGHYE